MRYLYGDSSESTLEINYLAFLRDAIDFGVAVLQAEHGLVQARERKTLRDRSAEDAARAVEHFGRVALAAVEPYAKGDDPVNRCAASVSASISDAVKREILKVRGGQGTDSDQIVGELQRLREKSVSALSALLATHDLPDADETVVVQWNGTGFEARMVQRVGWGLEVTMSLDIPPSSVFGHDLRVDKIADGVEVHAPETAGWLKKEVKMVPHKLGRYHITHVTVATNGVVMRVRATPEAAAAGFDISVGRRGDVTVERAGRSENEVTFDTDERDLDNLRAFAAKLEAAVDGLHGSRSGIVSAVLDGKALATHEHPAAMVERLVAAMAPVVSEIARHSLSPRELVLKRLLGGDRREEVFLSRGELEKKVQVLPPQAQRVFAPLGLVEPMSIEAREVEMEVDEPPPRAMPAIAESDPLEPMGAVVMGTTVASRAGRASSAPPPGQAEEPAIVIQAEAPPFPQTPPGGVPVATATRAPTPPPAVMSPFPPASDLAETASAAPLVSPPPVAVAATSTPDSADDDGPSITLEADLPPARVRPASLPSLPPLSTTPTRAKGTTVPPPAPPTPPPARLSVEATEAAVDAALRDLDDAEPTQVVKSAPRPGQ